MSDSESAGPALPLVARGAGLLLLLATACIARSEVSNSSGDGLVLPAQVDFRWRNTPTNNLRGAFFDEMDLTGSLFTGSWLRGATFAYSNLTGADLSQTELDSVDFGGATLTNANFTDATIPYAIFRGGFLSKEQLYSTASYKAGNLPGINFTVTVCTNWDLHQQNLVSAKFFGCRLSGADLSQANLSGVDFTVCTLTGTSFTDSIVGSGTRLSSVTAKGFTKEQLYSTSSYNNKDIGRIDLSYNNMPDWDFHQQNLVQAEFCSSTMSGADFRGADLTRVWFGSAVLTGASLREANLSGADLGKATLSGTDFTDAVISGASLGSTTAKGFTKEQLYSTASYKNKNLGGIRFWDNDLTGWDFRQQNLRGACFDCATLLRADFTDAIIGSLTETTARGFTKEQLYSTASYKNRDLSCIDLSRNDLTNWNLSGQNLSRALVVDTALSGANLSHADLTCATLRSCNLSGANLSGTNLYMTFVTDCDLSGANLTKANLSFDILTGTSFSGAILDFADLRGATVFVGSPASAHNTIGRTGVVGPLSLGLAEVLTVRDNETGIGVTVESGMTVDPAGVLQLVLADTAWGSTITLAPGVVPALGGTLKLSLAAGVNPTDLVGCTFHLFNWNGLLAPGNRFGCVSGSGFILDTGGLYTTGEVTLAGLFNPGDANGDLSVDLQDLGALKLRYGATSGATWETGDFNGDEQVNLEDFGLLKANYGRTGALLEASAEGVPEPAGLAMVALGALALRRRQAL